MIPLRDNIKSRRVPLVNYSLMILNVVIFVMQLLAPDGGESIVRTFGLTPANTLSWFFGDPISFEATFSTFFSYMFVHGGVMHILVNMLYLWIFGNSVEDYFGHLGYLAFYLLAGVGAGFIQLILSASSQSSIIGASGAISGVMGAYLILYPHAKVLTLVPILIFIKIMEVPAVLFLGLWILLQFASAHAGSGSGVAWWAHIGGFFVGILLLSLYRAHRVRGRTKRGKKDGGNGSGKDNVHYLN